MPEKLKTIEINPYESPMRIELDRNINEGKVIGENVNRERKLLIQMMIGELAVLGLQTFHYLANPENVQLINGYLSRF